MITSFKLPDLGEGVHEAEILAISISKGQKVDEGDIILEIETDKAAVEIPSPYTGTITDINVIPGDMVTTGSELLRFKIDDHTPQSASSETGIPEGHQSQGYRVKKHPVPASPATRRLARELGVDLKEVIPTGDGGIVTAEDIKQYATPIVSTGDTAPTDLFSQEDPEPRPAPPALPDFNRWGPIERQPFRSIRRATATQMAISWATIPHVNCQDAIDITELEAFRQRHKEEIIAVGGRLTMTVFAIKAVATALKHYPRFNASLDLENQEIIVKQYYHIGIAVDTEHGLVVPVVRDVEAKSIKELAIELQALTERAQQRDLKREELIGSTFTITNAGALGGSIVSPIINYPEVAILGMGQARMQPQVISTGTDNHNITPRLMMPISLSFDHRVLDGADAVRFLQVIIDALQDPDELLITMI